MLPIRDADLTKVNASDKSQVNDGIGNQQQPTSRSKLSDWIADLVMPPGADQDAGHRKKVVSLLSGGVAGIVSRTVTAPIDRVKILYQVSADRSFSLSRAAKSMSVINNNTGISGLWRGNAVAVYRIAPFAALSYTTYDMYHEELIERGVSKGVVSRFVAGAAAGTTATTLTYPLDLVRARLAAHWSLRPKYSGLMGGMTEIVRQEGFLALYAGLNPTLLGIVPYAGISFATFESLKSIIQTRFGYANLSDIPTPTRLACGAAAGLIAQTATYPLHIIRRRMQVETVGGTHTQSYKNSTIWTALRSVYSKEGLAGLFKGVTLSWLKAPVAVALSFTINDKMKSWLAYNKKPESDKVDMRAHLKETCLMVDPTPDEDQPQAKLQPSNKIFEKFIAGGISGMVAKTVIAPADRVKILYQVNPDLKFSLREAYRTADKILNSTGPKGLWRGHTATLIRVFPYAAITYTSYDLYQEKLAETFYGTNSSIQFISGASAGATAHTLTYPLDLMRARMAAHWSTTPLYTNYYTGFKHVVSTEGAASLFRGLTPTLVGIVPYAGLSFATFEAAKTHVRDRFQLQSDKEIPTALRLICGGAAGLFAQSMTYPLDIVRRRLQVDSAGTYKSMTHAFTHIFRKEGWLGLYKGLSMNWIKGPIGVGVSFTVNDYLKSKIRSMHVMPQQQY